MFNLSMQSQVTSGSGGSGNVGGFGRGVSIGSRTIVPFSPGSVNNPSGKFGPNGDIRNVYWVHGLNGDIGSWIRAANASQNNVAPGFQARKIKSISDITYGQSGGLLDASAQLESALQREQSGDRTKDFIIAHSQGGMVSRGLLHLNLCLIPKKKPEELAMGGLVTFCSPHQGAQLLSGKAEFEILSKQMCADLADGPTLEKVANFRIFGFAVNPKTLRLIDQTVDSACMGFSDIIIPYVLNKQTPNITKDYEVGAKILNQINGCLDGNTELEKFPKVAFYGVEPKEKLLLRTVKYFIESCNSSSYFEANEDYSLIDSFQKNYNKYYAKYIEWKNKYEDREREYHENKCYTSIRYYIPPCPHLRKLRQNDMTVRDAYLRGVRFLESMDDKYKVIIGALKFSTTTKMFCVCEGVSEFSKDLITDPSQCPAKKRGQRELMLCRDIEEVTVNRLELDSDGVVLASSASNLPGATFSPQEMWNTSHMQARNNAALKEGLTKLYSGGTDPFFYTPVK